MQVLLLYSGDPRGAHVYICGLLLVVHLQMYVYGRVVMMVMAAAVE